MKYVANQAPHCQKQFGSLLALSNSLVLLSYAHHLNKRTDESDLSVRILLLDFSKAFDRIDHYR